METQYWFPVEPVQTAFAPVISQVALALTVTVFSQLPGQLSRVTSRCSVKLPAAPAVTLTEDPVTEPTMVPLPVMDQL